MNLVVVVGGECLEGGVAGLEGDVPVEGIGEGGGFSGGLDADVGEFPCVEGGGSDEGEDDGDGCDFYGFSYTLFKRFICQASLVRGCGG